MEQQIDDVITYSGDWVLINVQFYKFWMKREEFIKFKLSQSDISDISAISMNIQDLNI